MGTYRVVIQKYILYGRNFSRCNLISLWIYICTLYYKKLF